MSTREGEDLRRLGDREVSTLGLGLRTDKPSQVFTSLHKSSQAFTGDSNGATGGSLGDGIC